MQSLLKYKDDSEKAIQLYNTTIEKYKLKLQNWKKMRMDFSKESEQLRGENRKRDEYLRRYAQSLEDYTKGKMAILNYEEEIERYSTNIKTIQGEITELNSQKIALQQKLPGLENEKKSFASSRNFKVSFFDL